MGSSEEEYELILFGATGYTGKLCAEHITTHLPTDLRWALAGRSASKLSALAEELKAVNPNRSQPGIEISTLTTENLNTLTRKARLLINTVGPYHLYSSPVLEACAKNGTHYLDVTGETPWVFEMIKKYHDIAKANNAIIIPEIGIESAPSDLLAFSIVSLIREKFSVGTREVSCCLHEMKAAPSGGTIATVLSILDHYSLGDLRQSGRSWAFSPIPGPKEQQSVSLLNTLFGVRSIPDLGTLTTSIAATTNRAIVQRSWGLLDGGNFYGQRFQYNEYLRVRNSFVGTALHYAFAFGALALAIPPFRWLVKRFVYAPGEGRSKDLTKNEVMEFQAIGIADQGVPSPARAFAKFKWEGGMYHLTGVLLAEAAILILRDETLAKRLGGGLLTPAMLGQSFIDRLKDAGIIFEAKLIPS